MGRIWCHAPGWFRWPLWLNDAAWLRWLIAQLSVPTDKGAHAGAKVSALVAGMVVGADSIADMALLRHGAMGTVFARPYAPSTLGSFLRAFTFGHVRQLDAVATRLLAGLHDATPLLAGIDGPVIPPMPPGWSWRPWRSTSEGALTDTVLAKARTATIRRTLINLPARIASSARRLTLHLPRDWPW